MIPLFETIWRVVDSHWRCINHPEITACLADYLWQYGFDIPATITDCLAENVNYSLQFRQFSGEITVFINPLNKKNKC